MEEINNKKEYQKKYFQEYYEKNKDYWKQKVKCDVCSGHYIVANKTRHINTMKHSRAFVRKQAQEQLMKQKEDAVNETQRWKQCETLLQCVLENLEEIKKN